MEDINTNHCEASLVTQASFVASVEVHASVKRFHQVPEHYYC